jgi:hypothetical protein
MPYTAHPDGAYRRHGRPGPYAAVTPCGRGTRVRLTAEGRALAERLLAERPRFYQAVRHLPLRHRGIVGACVRTWGRACVQDLYWQAAAEAVVGYHPDRGYAGDAGELSGLAAAAGYRLVGLLTQKLRAEARVVGGRGVGARGLAVDGSAAAPGETELTSALAAPPDTTIAAAEAAEYLDRLLATVTTREREVLFRRVGGETLDEIGNDLDVSRERVRQLEVRALVAARTALVRRAVARADAG